MNRFVSAFVAGLVLVSIVRAEPGQPPFDEVHAEAAKVLKKRLASKEGDSRVKDIPGHAVTPADAPRPGPELVRIKEILKDLPDADRMLFMDRLRLVDGRIASVYTAPLTKAFKAGRVNEMLDKLGGSGDGPQARSSGRPRLAELSKVLEGMPAEVKREFYDSMIFIGGELVSFRIDGLRKNATKTRVDEVLLSLGFDPANESALDSKGLCGGQGGQTWCNDSICDFPETGPLRCISEKDYTCKSATCKSPK